MAVRRRKHCTVATSKSSSAIQDQYDVPWVKQCGMLVKVHEQPQGMACSHWSVLTCKQRECLQVQQQHSNNALTDTL